MSLENGAIVRRWFEEVWNDRLEQTIDELITPESVCYTDEGPMRGAEEFKVKQYLPMITAFPDIRVAIEGLVAHDEQVVVRWTAAGTHTGDIPNLAATHKPVKFQGMSWIHVRDGKMMEGWQNSNINEVLRGLMGPVSS
jgi:steroid delta-isomerase-like uncharacterized protein